MPEIFIGWRESEEEGRDTLQRRDQPSDRGTEGDRVSIVRKLLQIRRLRVREPGFRGKKKTAGGSIQTRATVQEKEEKESIHLRELERAKRGGHGRESSRKGGREGARHEGGFLSALLEAEGKRGGRGRCMLRVLGRR